MRFAVLSLALLLGLVPITRADMKEDCSRNADFDRQVSGCTAVINSGEFAGEALAFVYAARGSAFDELGKLTHAIKDFDEAIQLNPRIPIAYVARGRVRYKLGEYIYAIEDFNEAIRLDPELMKAYYNRGTALNDLGNYIDAIKDFNKVIQLDSKVNQAYTNRGYAYASLGEYRRAIEDFDEAIRLNPESGLSYYNRGLAYQALLDLQAVSDYEESIRIEGAPRVRWWQEHLKGVGLYVGPINGVYDTQTREALTICIITPDC